MGDITILELPRRRTSFTKVSSLGAAYVFFSLCAVFVGIYSEDFERVEDSFEWRSRAMYTTHSMESSVYNTLVYEPRERLILNF